MSVDVETTTDRHVRFLAVEGRNRKGGRRRARTRAALRKWRAGDRDRRRRRQHPRPVPTRDRQILVSISPARRHADQPRIMCMTHIDTVPLCAGAKPELAGEDRR